MESQTIMRKDETGTRIDIEYEKGRKIATIHAQNDKLEKKELKDELFRYPCNPDDNEIDRAIKASTIFSRAYNLKKPDKVTELRKHIKKGIRIMTEFAETGYCSE